MNSSPDITEFLSLIKQPAFYVCGNLITECNEAAQRLPIKPGTDITDLFAQKSPQYDKFQSGYLFLSLCIHGAKVGATVTTHGNGKLFVLDTDEQITELKTLSLTAANIRPPLSAVIATTNSLSPLLEGSSDPKIAEHMDRINRHLYQLHRLLCNMSDVLQYAEGASERMSCQDIVSLTRSIFQRSKIFAEYCGVSLKYNIPDESILCTIDEQLLERGIFNMLSNAIKFSKKGSEVHASLVVQEKTLYITVCDNGSGIPPHLGSNIFHRYRRQPELEDSRYGMGLGLTLVRSAATVHGGTVLLDQPENGGTRICMNIPIRQSGDLLLRSHRTPLDYTGGWDHALLEFSDILPSHLYRSKN